MKLASLCLALVALTGCGGGEKSSPKNPQKPAETEARAAVNQYLTALARGDAEATCRVFSVRSREEIAKFGREKLKTQESCVDALKTLISKQPGAGPKALAKAQVLHIRVTGTTGQADVEGLDQPIRLVREGGEWRVLSEPTDAAN